MIAKISFHKNEHISIEEYNELCRTLGSKVRTNEIAKDENGKVKSFYSWSETFDPKEVDEKKKLVYKCNDIVELNTNEEYVSDLNVFMAKHPLIEIVIRGSFENIVNVESEAIRVLREATDKTRDALNEFNRKMELNEKTGGHMSNISLMNIIQTGYLVDCCTEELQDYLNEGWRILAVCPIPSQRRPDYVIGRTDNKQKLDCVHL